MDRQVYIVFINYQNNDTQYVSGVFSSYKCKYFLQ